MSERTYDHDHKEQRVIHVVFEDGADNPWSLDYHDLPALSAARAVLNYPITHFKSRDKAVEVAVMIRDIVKADVVHVEGEEDFILLADPEEKAPFFEPVSDEGSGLPEDEVPVYQEESTTGDDSGLHRNQV